MTTMLSRETFAAAQRFIVGVRRSLEVARFHCHFDGASRGPYYWN